MNEFYGFSLPAPPHKVRPFNFIGQLFLQMPGIKREDGTIVHTLTPQKIYDELKDVAAIRANNAKWFNDSSIPEGPRKIGRLPIYIANYKSAKGWNRKHGGAEIITCKGTDANGKQVIVRYELTTPELLNVWGQVMHTPEEFRANQIIKEWMASASGHCFPGMYDSIIDENGRIVPNDPTTGEPLLKFWTDQDIKLVLDMINEESTVPAKVEIEQVAESFVEEVTETQVVEPEQAPVIDLDDEDDDEIGLAPDEHVGDVLVISEKPPKQRHRPNRKGKAA